MLTFFRGVVDISSLVTVTVFQHPTTVIGLSAVRSPTTFAKSVL